MNKLIMDTLKPLDYPVAFANYNMAADTYIVFLEYNQAPLINADNIEKYTKRFYQVDIFSKGDFTQLVQDVKSRMKQSGFGRMFESETYDEDMQKYRKIIRFSYISKEEF